MAGTNPIPYVLLDSSGAVVSASESARKLLGWEAGGVRGARCLGEVLPDLLLAVAQVGRVGAGEARVGGNGVAVNRETVPTVELGGMRYEVVCHAMGSPGANGGATGDSPGHVLVELVPADGVAGEVPAGTCRPYERGSDSSAAELETVYANAPVGLCVLDRELRWVRINRALAEINGFSPEEHIGRRVTELLPDVAAQAEPALRRVLDTGEALLGVELRGTTPARPGVERRWIENFFPLRDGQGQVVGINVVCEEVTERRVVEEALRLSEERFRLAADAMQGIVYDVDVRTGRLSRTSGTKTLLGYEPDEVPSTEEAWRKLVHADDLRAAEVQHRRAMAGRAPFLHSEYRVLHKAGHWVWVSDHAVVIYDAEGRPARLVGCTVSIDERRRAEEALASANRALESANAAKDRFLAVLSHELRTPLAPVLMTLEQLEDREGLPADVIEALQMARRNIALETRLIDDLLDLSRITSGKLRLESRRVRLREVVAHVLSMLRSEFSGKKLDVVEEIAACPDEFEGDEARLQQVVWNLLKNAVKFTPSGGRVAVSVRPGLMGDRPAVELRVTDSGIGISAEAIPRIFDAFEQAAESVTRQFGGLGLGLAISKAIVDLHHGHMTAESDGVEKGATFRVVLPVNVEGARPGPAVPSAAPRTRHGRLRVLVVEDHADTARALGALLRISGHQVHLAGTARDALSIADREPLDLVISDLGLPDATGHDLMRELSNKWGVVGIALSGYGMEEDVRRSKDAGFVEHLTKPVSAAAIREAVVRAAGAIPLRELN